MGEDFAALVADLGLSALGLGFLLFLALLFSSYVKIITVLGMVRAGFGIGSLPAAFVTGGLAFSLSLFVMYPQLQNAAGAMSDVLKNHSPVTDRDRAEAVDAGVAEWKKFVQQHAQPAEVGRFQAIALKMDKPAAAAGDAARDTAQQLGDSWRILAPAFVVSQLREAFQTGLSIFLPFLVIDLLVAIGLAGVGLDRLNPAYVAFPFKILLFVALDGWSLITTHLVATYG